MINVQEAVAEGLKPVKDEGNLLKQAARDLEEEIRALDTEQQQIERECGDDLLNARFSGDTKTEARVAKDLERVRLKRTLLEKQLAACRARIDENRLEELKAEAEVCQTVAAKAREEAAAHRAISDDLLRQINEHEKCTYRLAYPRANMGEVQIIGISDSLDSSAESLDNRSDAALREARRFEHEIKRKRGNGAPDSDEEAGL